MAISAELVKKLREETDAPLMECREALSEAGGDLEKARQVLREKGKAAATKRTDRQTGAGVVAIAKSDDARTVGAVVLESETDFVARNEDFIAIAESIAVAFRDNDLGPDPSGVNVNGKTVGAIVEEAVAKIRENIKVGQAVRLSGDDQVAAYTHHDRAKGALVRAGGTASNVLETAYQVAIQVVAFPPKFLKKSDIPAEVIEREIEIETNRAIQDGKAPEIAKNIAQGRVNKEYVSSQVLLEQPFFKDPSLTVGAWVEQQAKAGGGSIEILGYQYLAVGASS